MIQIQRENLRYKDGYAKGEIAGEARGSDGEEEEYALRAINARFVHAWSCCDSHVINARPQHRASALSVTASNAPSLPHVL